MEEYKQSFDNKRPRIFISYKRNHSPDEPLALEIFNALKQDHDVFIDQIMTVGTIWAERIEAELKRSDFLISFLSETSVCSEMVLGEIEIAHRLAKERAGLPSILPIRLAFKEPFQYPLNAYLNPINWAYWENEDDTSQLIDELKQAISGGKLSHKGDRIIVVPPSIEFPLPFPSAQPINLEMPEGTMDSQSKFYKERNTDFIAVDAIKEQGGITLTIKAPRQMGKSSLLIRTIASAVETGKQVAFLDFQLIDKSALTDAEIFFKQFCYWITDALEMDDKVNEYWDNPLGHVQRCTRYISKHILNSVDCPLVLAMDEVDSIFETNFRSDFFGMLRSWHNSRAFMPIWKKLDLALVTSTEPYQLIENLNQSPFNVGVVVELSDFTSDEVADLNRRHDSPLGSEEIIQLMELIGGHPYLVRSTLYLLAKNRIAFQTLKSRATDDRGPFGDHLRYHLFRLHGKEDLIEGLRGVLFRNECNDDLIFFRLRGAGLVRREGTKVLPRCQLYADYFKERL
jgi:hypothetical protein